MKMMTAAVALVLSLIVGVANGAGRLQVDILAGGGTPLRAEGQTGI